MNIPISLPPLQSQWMIAAGLIVIGTSMAAAVSQRDDTPNESVPK